MSPKDGSPPESVSTLATHVTALAERRERVHEIVKRYDEAQLWETIQAKDVDPEIIDFVCARLKAGASTARIRKALGIPRATDKAWRKISAALKQGLRLDGAAFLQRAAWEYQALSDKLKDQIETALTDGSPLVDKDGHVHYVKGPTKELAMTVDTWNRLQQGFVKIGKDLGAHVDGDGNKSASGVTIIVQSAVALPTQNEVDTKNEAIEASYVKKPET